MCLIRSYGTPNGSGMCCVAQCYYRTWAMLKFYLLVGRYCINNRAKTNILNVNEQIIFLKNEYSNIL